MSLQTYFCSSIGKKQLVAVTGLALIVFVLGHMAGNLLIYGGPDLYNGYSKFLVSLRPGLYLIELGLAALFIFHMWVTALIVLENIQARGQTRYAVSRPVGDRSLATRLMPVTGTYIIVFLLKHLLDFTFSDHHGPLNIVHGRELGLYGVVYNAFADPWHSAFYILAMACLGLHLSHGIQSFFQTFGWIPANKDSRLKKLSVLLGWTIAILYSSIPVYVLMMENFTCRAGV